MDHVEHESAREKVRRTAMEAGILPHDPLAAVVDALADIPGDIAKVMTPALAEMQAARAAMERVAERPLLTGDQLRYNVLPALLALTRMWHGLLLVAALGLGFGLGMGVQWYFLTPALTCADQANGSRVCYVFTKPPTALARK